MQECSQNYIRYLNYKSYLIIYFPFYILNLFACRQSEIFTSLTDKDPDKNWNEINYGEDSRKAFVSDFPNGHRSEDIPWKPQILDDYHSIKKGSVQKSIPLVYS